MNKILHIVLRLFVVLIPIALFGVCYFLLGRWPNYLFNEIDIAGVYTLEKTLFGITLSDGTVLTPCEYFSLHHCSVMDILSGLFYLCWVPLPVFYALYLQFCGHGSEALRLTSAFLLVNILGFIGYYVHPASPPWYVMEYGFQPIFGTPGHVGGFEHFDAMTGLGIFHSIYAKNANVFAAIPSLHVAYNPVALYYAFKVSDGRIWRIVLSVVSIGIIFSAVYSCHHYIIDVTLGLLTSAAGILLFEHAVLRIRRVSSFYSSISAWLELKYERAG